MGAGAGKPRPGQQMPGSPVGPAPSVQPGNQGCMHYIILLKKY